MEKAVSFLEGIQQETHTENGSKPKGIVTGGSLSQDEMFDLVREGVSYYDDFVESASVNFSLVTTSSDYPGMSRATSGTWNGVFEFSGSQVRGSVTQNATQYGGELGETPLSGTQEFTYNGETFELLRETLNGTELTRRNNMAHNMFHDPRFWGWNLSGEKPLVDLVDGLNVENIQPVDWNGSQVYHVKGSIPDAMMDVDLWLNPEKSYRPERFMYATQSESATKIRVTKDFNFQEVAPDLWFPDSGQSVTAVINTETGEETNIETATMTLTDVRVNEHIPSSRFSIDPPVGTKVFDMRSRETYTVGEEEN